MDLTAAAKYMQLGYRIKRKSWTARSYINCISNNHVALYLNDLIADDWQVITENIIKEFPITYQE